jgi:TRAP-type C4-dicarboxylate transport system substrate-binding protein
MPAAHQKAFTEAARIAELYQRKIAAAAEARTLHDLGSQGVTLINIDTVPMGQRMTPYYTEFNAKVGGSQLIDAVTALRT